MPLLFKNPDMQDKHNLSNNSFLSRKSDIKMQLMPSFQIHSRQFCYTAHDLTPLTEAQLHA